MGGDYAPAEPVAGAVLAAREFDAIDLQLVGQESAIRAALATAGGEGLLASGRLSIVHTDEVIGMEEHAASAARSKPNSSMVVATRLAKKDKADACVTAGHSGAAMAAALFTLGRIRSVERPALAVLFPTIDGCCIILDVGANTDCRPTYLAQFAVMGETYARIVLGLERPRVGLLSNGEEDTKGSQLTIEAHKLLRGLELNFIGNVEGKDIPAALADVVVTDGFSGNVALKMAEGMFKLTFDLVRREAKRSILTQLGGALMRPAFLGVRKHVHYEEYGGAILLGVEGVAIVAHGRSSARAIRSAIRVAMQCAQGGIVDRIRGGIAAGSTTPVST
jgi:phosphate acyltransferase